MDFDFESMMKDFVMSVVLRLALPTSTCCSPDV